MNFDDVTTLFSGFYIRAAVQCQIWKIYFQYIKDIVVILVKKEFLIY